MTILRYLWSVLDWQQETVVVFNRLTETKFLNAIRTTAMSNFIIRLIKPTIVFTTTGLTFYQFSAFFGIFYTQGRIYSGNITPRSNLLIATATSKNFNPFAYFTIRFVILFEFRFQGMKSIHQTAITLTNRLFQQIFVFWNQFCQTTEFLSNQMNVSIE